MNEVQNKPKKDNGKKKKKTKRQYTIQARVTNVERKKIERAAVNAGGNVSDYIRATLLKDSKGQLEIVRILAEVEDLRNYLQEKYDLDNDEELSERLGRL